MTNPFYNILAIVAFLATVAVVIAYLFAIVVAMRKRHEFGKPSKYLLAALFCQFLPIASGWILSALFVRIGAEQFAILGIGMGIVRAIATVAGIYFFVSAVYASRTAVAVPANEAEGFARGTDKSNPYASPPS